ncbi:endolytic transglycosylase MltG [Cohnella caldifontis]|uniref:endolytic transglycosylase MltG n=1 Tax=Cohnella caldifontis TaxID=3027471 RepID=UPI0023EC5807|nr:endolytic transglycosylase MltG [Cohnella sp. YIM B05605]
MDREGGSNGWNSIYGNEPSGGRQNKEEREIGAREPRQPSVPEERGSGRSSPIPEPRALKEKPASNEPPDAHEPPAYRPRRKPRVMLWSFLIALCIVLATAGGALLYVWNGLRPVYASSTPIQVTIEKGMRAQRVAELLEENGLIRDATIFGGWLKLKGEGSKFQAGVYELTPGMTREEIVAKLNKGDIVAPATFRVTIPEGFTVAQIADRLAQNGGVKKEDFLGAVQNPALWSGSEWTAQIPQDRKLRYLLEGYLFPETYEIKAGSTAADIVNRMLAELDKKLDALPEDWQDVMQERGLTLHQLLTIASLVEREVVVDEERPIVASVIENRLKKKMPLQIDATIQYSLDKPKEKLTEEDLKVESPYNTYLNPGLPPGPIANPSLKSIEAALYPDDTGYYYYVTKKDGSNEHLFAVTFKQHQKNIQTSNQNAKKQ